MSCSTGEILKIRQPTVYDDTNTNCVWCEHRETIDHLWVCDKNLNQHDFKSEIENKINKALFNLGLSETTHRILVNEILMCLNNEENTGVI